MNSYQLLLLTLCLSCAFSTFTNTTDFWKETLGGDIHYQCYTGFEEIDWYYPSGQSGMFYSMFAAMNHPITEANFQVPLILWLQGGPGSSSQFGAYTEVGPIRIENGKPKQFHKPWNIFGHLMFIDQPLNVGYSFAGDRQGDTQVSSARQAADHLVNFLFKLYKQWPSLKASPLYITGESYAGHYIPSLAAKILDNTTFLQLTGIKLAGISIGDGWTDPVSQINYYDSYLYTVGIVSNKWRDTCTWFQTNAIENIYHGAYSNATSYFDFLTNNDNTSATYWGGISIFNFRKYTPMDQSFADFLEKNKVRLGVRPELVFISGNDKVYNSFANDITRSYAPNVATALNNMKVLIYNGQQDFVVNTAGVLTYLNGLNWIGTAQWKRTRKQIWTIYGQVAGWVKMSGNLWFVMVNKAGHMVPTDQPDAAFDMLGHFFFGDTDWKH